MSAAQAHPATRPGRGLPRLLAGIRAREPLSLAEHLAQHGPLPPGLWRRSPGLIELVDASGLRGRGGGSFPTGAKLRAVAAQRRRPVVVVNALEGEPLSGKDKVLLRHLPQLVLDGAVAAAASLGAREAIVALCETAGPERRVRAAAIADREGAAIDPGVALSLAPVPPGFVSGEETALVHFLNGGPAQPTARPPLPFQRGVGGAPTLVLNAETAAQLALIARFGPDWFRELGTSEEPGSVLVTVSGGVEHPGVFERALGTPLASLIEAAGGFSEPPQALLIGGYFGTWVSEAAARPLALSELALRGAGARLGAGAIAVLPASSCGLAETARVARYLAGQSARQCGPCMYGLDALAHELEAVAAGGRARSPRGELRRELPRLLAIVDGRGACRHPDGAVRFIASSLELFADDFEQHLRGAPCGRRGGVLPVPAGRRP